MLIATFFYRIAIALRESEDLNNEHTTMNHSRNNRRTVVRMQSKLFTFFCQLFVYTYPNYLGPLLKYRSGFG